MLLDLDLLQLLMLFDHHLLQLPSQCLIIILFSNSLYLIFQLLMLHLPTPNASSSSNSECFIFPVIHQVGMPFSCSAAFCCRSGFYGFEICFGFCEIWLQNILSSPIVSPIVLPLYESNLMKSFCSSQKKSNFFASLAMVSRASFFLVKCWRKTIFHGAVVSLPFRPRWSQQTKEKIGKFFMTLETFKIDHFFPLALAS